MTWIFTRQVSICIITYFLSKTPCADVVTRWRAQALVLAVPGPRCRHRLESPCSLSPRERLKFACARGRSAFGDRLRGQGVPGRGRSRSGRQDGARIPENPARNAKTGMCDRRSSFQDLVSPRVRTLGLPRVSLRVGPRPGPASARRDGRSPSGRPARAPAGSARRGSSKSALRPP